MLQTTFPKVIFLDRDGVIIEDSGYVTTKDRVHLIDGAAQAIKMLNNLNIKVIVISNQAAIARGMCTFQDVENINSYISYLLQDTTGAYIDRFYFCPHLSPKEFRESKNISSELKEVKSLITYCSCRKPSIGMITEAIRELNLEITGAYMIGDKEIDILCGKNALLKTIRIVQKKKQISLETRADFQFENLLNSVNFILSAG